MRMLLPLVLATLLLLADAFPPDPVFCDASGDCFITNSYGTWNTRQVCKVSQIVYPSNEEELLEAVSYGAKNKLKMKAVTKFSHSIPPLACPGDGDGGGHSGAAGLLAISTADYSRGIAVDVNSKAVEVDGGAQLQAVLDEAARHGLALAASPYWNGLSVAGILSTGSHGSSWRGKGGALHDHVLKLRMVVPSGKNSSSSSSHKEFAKIVTLTPGDGDLFYAAIVSLGTMGVISKVTLELEPMFKRSITNMRTSDAGLEDKIVAFGNEHEFGDVTWYPSKREAVYRIDDRVPANTPGNGINEFVGFQPTLALAIVAQRALEETLEAKRSSNGKCIASQAQVSLLESLGYGLKNTHGLRLFTGYPVVGFQHKIQTAGGCQESTSRLLICGWDSAKHALFYLESGITIPAQSIAAFIADVKHLRDSHPDAGALCGIDLYTGVLLRYVAASRALLGKPFDGVDLGFTYYRSRNGSMPRLNMDVWQEVEQMAISKYGGVPHWGKNTPVTFSNPGTGRSLRLERFVKEMRNMDPSGLFSTRWSDRILGIKAMEEQKNPGCALEGLCICSRDEHCAPEKSYHCRPGRVFTAARVCRYENEGS
ncbi:L-gulonolactone oxidase 3 [Selaginella moellendorffii]|nr:L-gulonolactone oxidase 3 [Selaginella moellendorffii]|eukprot:XP_002982221.2 L-gulonolactone oxidase 3 [Selaginella moellendorffii]